jgi:hypothetical protein
MKLQLTNKQFGRLLVIGEAQPNKRGRSMWNCTCACGTTRVILGSNLTTGNTTSCGCAHSTHGHWNGGKGSATYSIWTSMKARCNNPANKDYKNYGGRGITVCDSWQHSFEAFLKDMGERPKKLQLDRTDNEQGYSKTNCRWATPKEQSANRRNTILISLNGETKPLTEWCIQFSLRTDTVWRRIKKLNWPQERWFEQPRKHYNEL